MGARGDFFQRGSFGVGDGTRIRFWEDSWLGDTTLPTQYSSVYDIVRTKNVTVADILSQGLLTIKFTRNLT
jgi:hypothetical protein